VRVTARPEERSDEERRDDFLRGVRDDRSPLAVGALIYWVIVGLVGSLGLASWMHWQDTPTTLVAAVGGGLGLCLGLYAARGTSTLAHVLAAPGFLMELPF